MSVWVVSRNPTASWKTWRREGLVSSSLLSLGEEMRVLKMIMERVFVLLVCLLRQRALKAYICCGQVESCTDSGFSEGFV